MWRAAARKVRNTPSTLMRCTRWNSSSVISVSSVPLLDTPALAKQLSTRPSTCTDSAKLRSTCASSPVADAGVHARGIAALGGERVLRAFGLLRVRAPDRDLGAGGQQRPRHAVADAAIAAGDDDAAALED